jgi:hypothetical protein
MDKLEDAYDHYLHCLCFDEIQNRLFDNDYLKNKGIEDLSEEEIEIATDILRQDIGTRIDEDIDWGLCAMYAIDDVIAKRPPKEEPKPKFTDAPDAYYNKVLGMYGLADGDAFKIKGIPHIYHFDGGDLLYTDGLEDETATLSDYTLAQFLFEFKKEDIELVKPEPKDLLNDTLKMIGLETNQFFRINDTEFGGDDFYIDSFGDVYIVSGHPDMPDDRDPEMDKIDEYLTLGRILTQYYDKIVPWDIEEVGYA